MVTIHLTWGDLSQLGEAHAKKLLKICDMGKRRPLDVVHISADSGLR
jgi:hypothetical protein